MSGFAALLYQRRQDVRGQLPGRGSTTSSLVLVLLRCQRLSVKLRILFGPSLFDRKAGFEEIVYCFVRHISRALSPQSRIAEQFLQMRLINSQPLIEIPHWTKIPHELNGALKLRLRNFYVNAHLRVIFFSGN